MNGMCENCRYYLPVRTGYKEDGTCRYSPPAISTNSENSMGVWPRVKGTDWCGKYAPKEKTKKS